MVTDCELYLLPEEAFPLPESEQKENGSEVMVGAVLKKEKKKK
jgi:hypothetical protein